MSYFRRPTVRRGMLGMGDYSDTTQCSEIPLGDPYRKPGNYCATPDGGTTTFNADGTTYRAPGYAVDPDPAHPLGTPPAASSAGGSFWDKLTSAVTSSIMPTPTVVVPPPSTGMSTTTMLALAAAGVAAVVLLSRR
jgi:hypothetical protein